VNGDGVISMEENLDIDREQAAQVLTATTLQQHCNNTAIIHCNNTATTLQQHCNNTATLCNNIAAYCSSLQHIATHYTILNRGESGC